MSLSCRAKIEMIADDEKMKRDLQEMLLKWR